MKKITYFAIWGKYLLNGKKEKIDSATNINEAYRLLGEYSMAFGKDWEIYCPQLEER